MANQQLFPQNTYPAKGDLSTTAGSPNTTVTGLQTIPVLAGTPQDQQVLQYSSVRSEWEPGTVPFNKSVQVNGVAMSDDYDFWVKFVDMAFQTNSTYPPNGNPVLVNGV